MGGVAENLKLVAESAQSGQAGIELLVCIEPWLEINGKAKQSHQRSARKETSDDQ